MPRSPVTYNLPPGTVPQIPDTVIPSAMFNAAMNDIAQTFNAIQPLAFGGTNSSTAIGGWDVLNSRGTAIATAPSMNLDSASGANIHLTGTATVTAITLSSGAMRFVIADGAATYTASATLVVNGSTTGAYLSSAGDLLVFLGDVSSTTRMWVVASADGPSLDPATPTEILTGTNNTKFGTPDSIAALWEAGSDNTGGATITLGDGAYFNLITSTATITAFAFSVNKAGRTARVRFNTVRTLTHNATSLILPGGANITTAVGDICQVRSLGGGNVVVDWYTKANGRAVVEPTPPASGQPIPSTSNLAVGSFALLGYTNSTTVNNNSNTAGSNLSMYTGNGGSNAADGGTMTGTWKNITGANVGTGTTNPTRMYAVRVG